MTKFMLKKFIQTALLLVVLCTTATTYAQVSQAPDGIQFQALATDANGHPAAGRVIYVKDAIVAKTATGTIVYSETFKVTASSAGIFTIVLGKGTYASGVSSISNIDWANGPFFLNLKIAVEPTVPTASWNVNNEYVDLGTSQFWSVPYALYAGNVKGADGKLNTSDTAAMLKPYFTSINLKANIESPTFTGTVSGITKAMVGLGNVDNTADINKPVSTAAQTALDLKANTADVTTALDLKVDKVTGKALSTNDYTTAEKTKLAAITGTNTGDQDLSSYATTTQLAAKANSSDVTTSLATKANASDVTTSLATKANASDVTTSLATKVDKVTGKDLSSNDYTMAEKTKLAAITGTNTGDQINITGNAATATKLQNARTINGIAFDGSADITLPATPAGIPYTGATQAVDLGAFDLKVNGLTVGRGNNGNTSSNIAIGKDVLRSVTGGSYLTAVGHEALYSNTTGYNNTAIGSAALKANTSGLANTSIGSNSLQSNTIANFVTAVGNHALRYNTTGGNNTAVGSGALEFNTTGELNSAFGYDALKKNTTGIRNTATGVNALVDNTTGNDNTATGFGALLRNTTGSNNTATGWYALALNTTGADNTAVGYTALYPNTTGNKNTAVGQGALKNNSTGNENSALGEGTLANNTSGNYNSAFGRESLHNSNGDNNTAIGWRAGFQTGSNNTSVGWQAGYSAGNNNTAIGAGANFGASNLTNATAIGYQANVATSNTIRLGNTAVTTIGGQVGWTAASDSRIKKNITNSNYGLATVLKLRSVEYNLISNDLKQVGFIAQEVQKLVPEVVTGKEGDLSKGEILGITYSNLVPVLTKAIQEQQKIIETLQKEIEELKKLVNGLKK